MNNKNNLRIYKAQHTRNLAIYNIPVVKGIAS
jgi:hypothetical protein